MMRGRLVAITAALTVLLPLVALARASNSDAHATVVRDGSVKITVRVDKVTARVADPIQVVVEVVAPKGTHVELPQLQHKWGDFDICSSKRVSDLPMAKSIGERLWILRMTLETIKSGDLTLPPLDVHYALDSQLKTYESLHTPPIRIHIVSVLEHRVDPAKFRDIKGTVDVVMPESTSYTWLMWTPVGAVIAALLMLATGWLAKRNRGLSPAAWARFQIAELRQLQADGATTAESLYNELADVVRQFFALEFDVPALTQTTSEFLTEVADTVGLGETPHRQLSALVQLAEDVKFAGLTVNEHQLRQAFENATAIVEACEQRRSALERKAE